MGRSLVLAVLLWPVLARAGESPAAVPTPQLVHLEQALAQKQEARDKGELPPEKYELFVAGFKSELTALMGRISGSPENEALHAQLIARLGEPERAQAGLEEALAKSPENPALLVSQGNIHYEQKDYPAAAESARRAWEASGRTDKRAWALLKMSEGRTTGVKSVAPTLTPAADFARPEWSIPENNDINAQAMVFVRQAIAARRKGDMAATMKNVQAAMNADPTSNAVQRLYGLAQADQAKQAETGVFIKQAVDALEAGSGAQAVAWAQKAYDRNPSDDTYGILQDVRARSSALVGSRVEQPHEPVPAPDRPLPLLPLAGAAGLGLAAYGVYRSKFAYESRDGFDEERRPVYGRGQRFVAGAVLAGLGGAAVYLVGGAALGFAPAVMSRAVVAGNQGMRLMNSEAGAIRPQARAAIPRAEALPEGMSFPRFGNAVMKWGQGDATARERISTLTKEELVRNGITREMAVQWRDFYRIEKVRVPQNPSAAGRAELMERAVDLLGEP